MKKFLVVLLFLSFGMLLVAGSSWATYINASGGDGANSSLQDVLDGITISSPQADNSSSVGAAGYDNDALSDALDSYWNMTASSASVTTMIIELAGLSSSNTFGIYDPANQDTRAEIFDGSAGAGNQATLSIRADGSIYLNNTDTHFDLTSGHSFGYYLTSQQNTFYSDTSLNDDNFDHLVAFQGQNVDTVQLQGLDSGTWTNNEYILGWEDLYGGGDKDYQDMVLMVESVHPAPVPEPATMLLLGMGLCGLAFVGRKKLIRHG